MDADTLALFGAGGSSSSSDDDDGQKQQKQQKQQIKQSAGSRPPQLHTTRVPVPVSRPVFAPRQRFRPRDPRFDSAVADAGGEADSVFSAGSGSGSGSGSLSTVLSHRYAFVAEMRQQEIAALRVQLRREKDEEKRLRLQETLARMIQAEKERERAGMRVKVMQQWKKEEKEKVKGGKNPFYLKRSAQRQLELTERYQQLAKTGGVDKFMRKQRKKKASRDRRIIPERRGLAE